MEPKQSLNRPQKDQANLQIITFWNNKIQNYLAPKNIKLSVQSTILTLLFHFKKKRERRKRKKGEREGAREKIPFIVSSCCPFPSPLFHSHTS